MVVNEEPRAAVIARLDTPVGPLTVANTHLSFVPGWNRRANAATHAGTWAAFLARMC